MCFTSPHKKGQAAYHEIARHGLFEGSGTRAICLQMMAETNPHKPGTRKHTRWEQGWREASGVQG